MTGLAQNAKPSSGNFSTPRNQQVYCAFVLFNHFVKFAGSPTIPEIVKRARLLNDTLQRSRSMSNYPKERKQVSPNQLTTSPTEIRVTEDSQDSFTSTESSMTRREQGDNGFSPPPKSTMDARSLQEAIDNNFAVRTATNRLSSTDKLVQVKLHILLSAEHGKGSWYTAGVQ